MWASGRYSTRHRKVFGECMKKILLLVYVLITQKYKQSFSYKLLMCSGLVWGLKYMCYCSSTVVFTFYNLKLLKQVRNSFDINTATLAMAYTCTTYCNLKQEYFLTRNMWNFPSQLPKKKKKQEYPPAFRKDVTKFDLKEDCLKKLILAIIFKACDM